MGLRSTVEQSWTIGLAGARTHSGRHADRDHRHRRRGEPATYRVDGTEAAVLDPRTGAERNLRRRFTLVAGGLALTTLQSRVDRGQTFSNTMTDAYWVDGDTLTVERQLTAAIAPSGTFAAFMNPSEWTFVYRRQP